MELSTLYGLRFSVLSSLRLSSSVLGVVKTRLIITKPVTALATLRGPHAITCVAPVDR